MIPGAGTGIGQATAVEFFKHGYNVAISGRTKSTLENTSLMCDAHAMSAESRPKVGASRVFNP